MDRVVTRVSLAALLVFLAASLWIGQLEGSGPPHADLMLPGGVPATLFEPGPPRTQLLEPPPVGERPPAVVVMHGFAGDRLTMGGIARHLAASGYAVLSIDAAGHGQNRNPYPGNGEVDAFLPDLRAAVDLLRSDPFVDGSRIAVLGQSMGGWASLDFATRDSGIDAAVLISGGKRMLGPYRPPNVLFLFAEGDSERKRERVLALAARLADADPIEIGPTYGRHDRHDAVRVVEVPDASHVNIIRKATTLRETVAWLDASLGVERPPGEPAGDGRGRALLLLWLSFALLLPGLGLLVGRIVPHRAPQGAAGRGAGLLGIAVALLLALPLLAVGTPAEILSIELGDVVGAQLALAGIALLVGVRLARPNLLEGLRSHWLRSLLGAAVGVIALFALLQPLGAGVHRMTLTPERVLVFGMLSIALLLFALPFNVLLRRGPAGSAALFAAAGRITVLLVLFAAVQLGVLDRVMLQLLPALLGVALAVEVLAAGVYAASRNPLAIALIDAACLALVLAATMPIRI